MRIPKKKLTELQGLEVESEEKYEEYKESNDVVLCRVLHLIFIDGDSFFIVIDGQNDTLENVKEDLAHTLEAKTQHYPHLEMSHLQLAYFSSGLLHPFSSENERTNINELLFALSLDNLIIHHVFTIFVLPNSDSLSILPSFSNELFREHIKIDYITANIREEKMIVGRILPKPEIMILNFYGFIEDHLKLKQLEYIPEEENHSVLFKSNLEGDKHNTKKIEYRFIFPSDEEKGKFLTHLEEILASLQS